VKKEIAVAFSATLKDVVNIQMEVMALHTLLYRYWIINNNYSKLFKMSFDFSSASANFSVPDYTI
jgi:hypothetical protein